MWISTGFLAADRRLIAITIFIIVTLIAVLFWPPIPQDQSYHAFADGRTWLGIPNAANVLSNLSFVLVSILGLVAAMRNRSGPRSAWLVVFGSVILVSFGSSYYHWNPGNDTLFWDRLPMAIGFMALLVALGSEFIDPRLEKLLLLPATALGALSAIYWHLTDDLRFYAWVQFAPLVVIVLILFLYPSRYAKRRIVGMAIGLYFLAKMSEAADVVLFQLSNQSMSGHSVKHLLAAAACLALVVFVHRRKSVTSGDA